MPADQIIQPSDPRYHLLERELKQTLSKNLNGMDKTYPMLAKLLRKKVGEEKFTIKATTSNGKMTSLILRLGNYQSYEMLNPNIQENIEKRMSNLDIRTTIPLIIGVESGYDYLVLNDFTRITDTISRDLKIERPVYVIEPLLERFLIILFMFDLRPIFEEERFFFFVGEDAILQFANFFRNPDVMFPNIFIYINDEKLMSEKINRLLLKCIDQRKQNLLINIERVQSHYQSLPPSYWQTSYGPNPGRPLRIISLTSRFTTFLQYATRDILEGFQKLGHETKILIEQHNTHRINTLSTFAAFADFKPDMIFLMDHFRWEHDFRFMDQVPVVTWIQDALDNILTDRTDIHLTDRDFVFCFSNLWLRDGTFNRPFYQGKKIHFLPVGINTKFFHPEKEIAREIDVLFVTHLINPIRTLLTFRNPSSNTSKEREIITIEDFKIDHDTMQQVCREIIHNFDTLTYQQLCEYVVRPDLLQILGKNAFEKYGIDGDRVPKSFLSGIESPICMELLTLIKAIPMIHLFKNGINVQIYGRNWDRFTELKPALKGPANNGFELNRLMNKSRICINNSAGTSLHMRALEILGSGGFLMTRRIQKEHDTASILDFFTEGEDFVFFDNEVDLLEKTRYFLTHESIRQTIAEQGYRKACLTFGYDALARNILDVVSRGVMNPSSDRQGVDT